jgi:hypothetical protein
VPSVLTTVGLTAVAGSLSAGTVPCPEATPEVAAEYRFADCFFHDLAALDEASERVSVEEIGQTREDRPIWAFRVEPTAPSERRVLVFAGLHALEWIGTEAAVDLVIELARREDLDATVTVVPLANPDGRARVEQDLLLGRDVYRRGNSAYVDLNRDWAVLREPVAVWADVIPSYYTTSPGPLSQRETRALDALADRERFHRAASLHAFGGYLYHPWSGSWRRPPDWDDFATLGAAMEAAQGARAYRTRQLSKWGFFFRAHGSEIDHLYGTYGTRAFLIEITRSGVRLTHPKDLSTYFRWYNPVHSTFHRDQTLEALRVLVDHPLLDGERALRPPTLPEPPRGPKRREASPGP